MHLLCEIIFGLLLRGFYAIQLCVFVKILITEFANSKINFDWLIYLPLGWYLHHVQKNLLSKKDCFYMVLQCTLKTLSISHKFDLNIYGLGSIPTL